MTDVEGQIDLHSNLYSNSGEFQKSKNARCKKFKKLLGYAVIVTISDSPTVPQI